MRSADRMTSVSETARKATTATRACACGARARREPACTLQQPARVAAARWLARMQSARLDQLAGDERGGDEAQRDEQQEDREPVKAQQVAGAEVLRARARAASCTPWARAGARRAARRTG